MATKNLARTVIEGGRYYHNAWFRRHSSKVERAKVRQCLSTIRSDILLWEDTVLPVRDPVCKLFRDKLSPAYRFLSSRVGKPWNETHALLRQRFDDRAFLISGESAVEAWPNFCFETTPRPPGRCFRWLDVSRADRDLIVPRRVNAFQPLAAQAPRADLSLSRRIAGTGLRSRLSLVRLQAGRPRRRSAARGVAPGRRLGRKPSAHSG